MCKSLRSKRLIYSYVALSLTLMDSFCQIALLFLKNWETEQENNKYCSFLNTLASARIQGFSEKKHLNACGFAQQFLQSGMLYRPGKSLKRQGKSSSLHSKENFLLWGAFFLWVTS